MFNLRWTEQATGQYSDLRKKAIEAKQNRAAKGEKKSSPPEGLFKQVAKAIDYLRNDPHHPSLNTHKYQSIPHPFNPDEPVFEAYAQNDSPGAYRVFWCYGPVAGELTIISITPHP